MITILALNPTFGAAYNLRRAFSMWEETRLITLETHPLWPGEEDIILTRANADYCRSLIESSRFTMIADAAGLGVSLDLLMPTKANWVAFWGDTAYWQEPHYFKHIAEMLEVKTTFAMMDLMDKAAAWAVPLCHPVLDFGWDIDKPYPLQIMHSPRTENKRKLKGTDKIERVVDQLKQEFPDLVYTSLLNLPWRECLAQKRKAHIFIDQIPDIDMPAGLGRSGEEALAFGSVVITALRGEEYLEGFFPAPPVVKAYDENGLYQELRTLCLDRARVIEWGKHSRQWAEKYLLFPGWLGYVGEHLRLD
jgi:hypothetical protein